MGSAKTPYAGSPAVVDVEAGPVDAAAIKSAGLVAEKFYDNREMARIDADLADHVLDADTSRTRATRDRDRSFPRDMSQVNPRKRRTLPEPGEFRGDLSSRQRKDRSAAKRRVIEAAPAAQIATTQKVIGDPQRWADINTALHKNAGDAQQMSATDRATVQRVDRLIQSYERATDRSHVVYVAVTLPTNDPVTRARDVPDTLAPGARISFDQFTVASHTVAEAQRAAAHHHAGSDSTTGTAATVILEIETSRGMYLGRSDSLDDTSHLLPRGMAMQVQRIDPRADYATTGGHDTTLVVQLSDTPRDPAYQPPLAGRQRRRINRASRAAAATAAADADTTTRKTR